MFDVIYHYMYKIHSLETIIIVVHTSDRIDTLSVLTHGSTMHLQPIMRLNSNTTIPQMFDVTTPPIYDVLLVVKISHHWINGRTQCRATITLSSYCPLNTDTNILSTMGYASCYYTHRKVLQYAQCMHGVGTKVWVPHTPRIYTDAINILTSIA